MKKLRTLLATALIILPSLSFAQSAQPQQQAGPVRPNDELIVSWLRKNAVPTSRSVALQSHLGSRAPCPRTRDR